MSSTNVPCQNPDLCKVKTHRAGTRAECQLPGGTKGKSKQSGGLAATPALASSGSPKVPQFHDGGPDAEIDQHLEQNADKYGWDLTSRDERDDPRFLNLTPEQKESYGVLRQTLKDKLGLHLAVDVSSTSYAADGEEMVDTYLIHKDGRAMMGDIGPDSVELMLWDDFGDGSSLSGQDARGHGGDMDAYMHHVGARFDKLCREYADGT